jgi:mediator of RNA polymerase II transcription subunit 17
VVQVFDLVNREASNPSLGVNVTGIRENYLQLSLGQGTCVFVSLAPSSQGDQMVESLSSQNIENAILPLDTLDGVKLPEEEQDTPRKKWGFPNCVSYEIYLQQIFHEHVFMKAKDRPSLLGHFCMSLDHRIFSNKVLMELENVVWTYSSFDMYKTQSLIFI